MNGTPVLKIREWSEITPDSPVQGDLLRDLRLSKEDRDLIEELKGRSSLKFTELRSGLGLSVGPDIGTVNLSGLRIVITPKIRIENLMRMVAYAFDLSDLVVTMTPSTYEGDRNGLIDLFGLALLDAVDRIARGGILPKYQQRHEDLSTLRGRLDFRHIATRPRSATLKCVYDDLTADHELNQVVAAGLRLASGVMQSVDLRLDLARSADRVFGDLGKFPLDGERIRSVLEGLDRSSSHYRTAMTLIALIYQGARLGDHVDAGAMPLTSFTLNMNMVFERFLARYLSTHAPAEIRVTPQDHRSGVFTYLENAGGWTQPSIRPDFVFHHRRHGRHRVIAIADAKYKNRHENRPTASELYQLTTYGLAYPLTEPREVILLHPLGSGDMDRATTLQFASCGVQQRVWIRLVGVPVDKILEDSSIRWWPL